jgi:hypothetical protein
MQVLRQGLAEEACLVYFLFPTGTYHDSFTFGNNEMPQVAS